MTGNIELEQLVSHAERSIRTDSGILWDCQRSRCIDPIAASCSRAPHSIANRNQSLESTGTVAASHALQGCDGELDRVHPCKTRTHGAVYSCDGSFEGILSAIYHAMLARDATADILEQRFLQPRIGQQAISVETSLEEALKVRRCVEHALGRQAFSCIQAAITCDHEAKGTIVYRFIQQGLAACSSRSCNACARKQDCLQACDAPSASPIIDDIASPAVHDLIRLYRQAMNERHLMEQFVRFEHCEGDMWFARCNPKA